MRMYEAAANMLEDAICDLVEELRPTRPETVLAEATDTHGLGGWSSGSPWSQRAWAGR